MASKFAPFPLPFRVGTDICHIPRVKQILHSRASAKFISRILTEEERAAASRILEPVTGRQAETAVDAVNEKNKPEAASGLVGGAARFMASRSVPIPVVAALYQLTRDSDLPQRRLSSKLHLTASDFRMS